MVDTDGAEIPARAIAVYHDGKDAPNRDEAEPHCSRMNCPSA